MNHAPATLTEPPPAASSSCAGLPPGDWAATYFKALAEHSEKALAAQKAGQPLPVIVRRRHADPAFAQREAEVLEVLGDLLESEAIRRVTHRDPGQKHPCSNTLLLRLLEMFHPKWSQKTKGLLARMAPAHCSPLPPPNGGPFREFNFQTKVQRLQFRKWQRDQAIATALRLFYITPEELDARIPAAILTPSVQAYHRVGHPTESPSSTAAPTRTIGRPTRPAVANASFVNELLTSMSKYRGWREGEIRVITEKQPSSISPAAIVKREARQVQRIGKSLV